MSDAPAEVPVLIISPDGVAAETARQVGARLLNRPSATLLVRPLSPTGHPPVTHWLCETRFPREVFEMIVAYPTRHGTEVLDGRTVTAAEALAQRGLKPIAEKAPAADTAARS